MRRTTATVLISLGLVLGLAGVWLGELDDAPGAALLGLALMAGLVALGVRAARRRPEDHPA